MSSSFFTKQDINKLVILLLLIAVLLISINCVNASDVDSAMPIESDAAINVNGINVDMNIYTVNVVDDLDLNEAGVGINPTDSGSNLNTLSKNEISVGDSNSNSDIYVEDLPDDYQINGNATVTNESYLVIDNNTYEITTNGSGHFVINDGSNKINYYVYDVNNESDLKYISNYIADLRNKDDIVIINFAQNIVCTGSESNVFFISSRKVMIFGNGYTIYSKNHHQFITLDLMSEVEINDLVLSGFNNVIDNYGTLYLDNVSFVNNTGDIINSYGTLQAVLCDFNNNKVINGAIVPHDSVVSLTNCSFDKNVLNKDNSVCVDLYVNDGSTVNVYLIDGFDKKPITKCYNEGHVTFRNTTDSTVSNITVDSISGQDIISIANQVYQNSGKTDIIIVNLCNGTNYNINIEDDSALFHPRKGILIINGNGATVNINDFDDGDEKHFLICDENVTVMIYNMTIKHFNNAIINYGNVILNNVTLDSNKVNYWYTEDRGGAIKNYATLSCIDCNFTNNYAKYGGAIYTIGQNSKVNLTNCFFRGNKAYGGNDYGHSVYMAEGAELYVYNLGNFSSDINIDHDDAFNRIFKRNSLDPIVREFVVNDSNSLHKAVSAIWDDNFASDVFIVNVSGTIGINPWSSFLFHPRYGKLIINGYNSTIYVYNAQDDDEYHFAYVEPWGQMEIYGLRIAGFNGAIYNYGYTYLEGVNFLNNKVDYWFEEDACGAIYNYGFLYCTGCSFIDNEGDDCNVAFNGAGAISYFINCSFSECGEGIVNILNFDGGKSVIIDSDSNKNVFIGTDESIGFWDGFLCHLSTFGISAVIGMGIAMFVPGGAGVIAAILAGGFIGGGAELAVTIAIAEHNHNFDMSLFDYAPVYFIGHALNAYMMFEAIAKATVLEPMVEEPVTDIYEFNSNTLSGWKQVIFADGDTRVVISLESLTEDSMITSDPYINSFLYDIRNVLADNIKNIKSFCYLHTSTHIDLCIWDSFGTRFFISRVLV